VGKGNGRREALRETELRKKNKEDLKPELCHVLLQLGRGKEGEIP